MARKRQTQNVNVSSVAMVRYKQSVQAVGNDQDECKRKPKGQLQGDYLKGYKQRIKECYSKTIRHAARGWLDGRDRMGGIGWMENCSF